MSDRVYHLRGPMRSGFQRTACGIDRDPMSERVYVSSFSHRVTCAACKAVMVDGVLGRAEYNTLDTGEPNDP